MTLDVRSTFRDHVYGCFIDDIAGIRCLDLIGEDNVMCETDYPHSDTTWPHSIQSVMELIGHLPKPTQRKLLRAERGAAVPFHCGRARPARYCPLAPDAATGRSHFHQIAIPVSAKTQDAGDPGVESWFASRGPRNTSKGGGIMSALFRTEPRQAGRDPAVRGGQGATGTSQPRRWISRSGHVRTWLAVVEHEKPIGRPTVARPPMSATSYRVE